MMELPKDFMLELVRTRKFSDFTFKVSVGRDHKVHKLILAATSPVLEQFLRQHDKEADLFELLLQEGREEIEIEGADHFTKLALSAAMADVFAFCYLRDYNNTHRDSSGAFDIRVLSHLLTHDLAHRFQIAGLVALSTQYFLRAFAWFCANSTSEDVKTALQRCFSPASFRYSGLTGHALGLLHGTALTAFANQIGAYKTSGRFREALELLETVPLATAELYRQPLVPVEQGEQDEEEGGEEEVGKEACL